MKLFDSKWIKIHWTHWTCSWMWVCWIWTELKWNCVNHISGLNQIGSVQNLLENTVHVPSGATEEKNKTRSNNKSTFTWNKREVNSSSRHCDWSPAAERSSFTEAAECNRVSLHVNEIRSEPARSSSASLCFLSSLFCLWTWRWMTADRRTYWSADLSFLFTSLKITSTFSNVQMCFSFL